ncbi:molybdopterin cofactor-binding domain-containing protein [Amycolatopsis nalaikhensis]|uniref:molybdopterin cofactor-binding domain-containing protein n=1 Tax=Amycolatopsis nalaikhensis TaxID=715472 RepID=UPI00332BFBC3
MPASRSSARRSGRSASPTSQPRRTSSRSTRPPGMQSGLEESHTYDHPYTTLPSPDRSDLGVFYPIMGHACHIAVVEVDPDTGQTSFLDYVAVHDAGTVVNPKSLGGHVTGGSAQGLGSTLYEELAYDEDGQFSSRRSWTTSCRPRTRFRRSGSGTSRRPRPTPNTASRAVARAAGRSPRRWCRPRSTMRCASTGCA